MSDELPCIEAPRAKPARVFSIDVLRAFVMFTMIFVNDLNGEIVPNWMRHFSDTHHHGESGMTFVDMVFPGFLFIVGMSIPFALGARLGKQSIWQVAGHVLGRTGALLAIGIMMVNSEAQASTKRMGWSGDWWNALLYLSAILALVSFAPIGGRTRPPPQPSPGVPD